jgi:glutathione S-transferase
MTEQMLEVGEDKTTLGAATLLVGWRTISRDYFRNDPPSAFDLENAIAAIEDEIARTHKTVAHGPAVVTTDETIRDIALASGVPAGPDVVLPIDAVERTYARMTARLGLPGNPRFAATVLLLRELMHHLQIERVFVRAD